MRSRHLTEDEISLGRSVFEDSIEWNRIAVTDRLGLGRRPFTVPGLGDVIYLNLGPASFASPVTHRSSSYPVPGQIFIHELVHAWQICHRNRLGYLAEGVTVQLRHQFGGNQYALGAADSDWDSLNLEQQAAAVDRWFAGSPGFAPMSEQSPLFHYVRDSIRK